MRSTLDRLQPVIDRAIGAFAGGSTSPVLRDRARVLAAKALEGYDPTRGAKLSTHVYGQLQGLRQIRHKLGNPMPAPEQLRRDRGTVLQAAGQLRDSLLREPSDDEVADELGVPVARVERVMRAARIGVPLSALEADEDEDRPGRDVISHTRTPEDDWMEAVDHDLSPVDKLILRYRTGYGKNPVLSNQEIARRLGMSAPAISQRAARIQARLDEFHPSPNQAGILDG